MSNTQRINSTAITVLKKDAEKVRQLLISHTLLRVDLRIKLQDDLVFLPITNPDDPFFKSYTIVQTPFEVIPHKFSLHELILETLGDEETPSQNFYSLDIVGEVGVLKISPQYLGKAQSIAETIQKHSHCTHVFLKEGAVEGTFRLPKLVLLAGNEQPEYKTVHQEHGLKIYVDITKAYFSDKSFHEKVQYMKQFNDNYKKNLNINIKFITLKQR